MAQHVEVIPRTDLEAYLNPLGADMDHDTLLRHAASIREAPIYIPNLGLMSGIKRIPFEMARFGLVPGTDVADALEVRQTVVDDAMAAASNMSRLVLAHQLNNLRLFEQDHPDLIYQAKQTKIGMLLVAANLAAEEGHRDQYRESDPPFPYIWHPRAMQAARFLVWVSSDKRGESAQEECMREQAVAAVHDVIEMGLEKQGFQALARTEIVTPQDFGVLALELGDDAAIITELVADYRSVTKFPGPRPEGMTSLERNIVYIMALTHRAKVAKSTDTFDNLHNRKPGQSDQALEKYRWALENIPRLLEEAGEFVRASTVRAVASLDPQLVREFFTEERDTYHDVLAFMPAA